MRIDAAAAGGGFGVGLKADAEAGEPVRRGEAIVVGEGEVAPGGLVGAEVSSRGGSAVPVEPEKGDRHAGIKKLRGE